MSFCNTHYKTCNAATIGYNGIINAKMAPTIISTRLGTCTFLAVISAVVLNSFMIKPLSHKILSVTPMYISTTILSISIGVLGSLTVTL